MVVVRIKEAALPCCGCGGGGCRRLREAEAEATEAYLRRVCRLKEEGRQLKCQRKNRKSRAVPNFIFLRSIAHALLPKCRETFEGRSGLVGPESHGRGGLSEIE